MNDNMKRILLFLSLISIGTMISFAYAQNNSTLTSERTFLDNSTETPMKNLIIQAEVVPDEEAYSFTSGQVYKINDPNGIFVNFNPHTNATDYQIYPYLSSPNRIDFSEDSIRVNFAFKLPISNITSQIERIDTTFPVNTITNYPNNTTYRGWSSYPITINGTEYQPNIFFVLRQDSPSYISIENFPP